MNDDDKELFEQASRGWEVISIPKRQNREQIRRRAPVEIMRHELLYNGKVQTQRKGQGGLEQLRAIAKFLNERGMEPRPRIQCLADQ
jgi:hypothetical protein